MLLSYLKLPIIHALVNFLIFFYRDYLLGFRKRKQERADHYKKKIEKQLAEEKLRKRHEEKDTFKQEIELVRRL